MLARVRYRDPDRGVGVEAFSDGYAFDDYSCLYLLSVAGRENCVKAITSAVVSSRMIEILADTPVEVSAGFGRHYRILSTRLPDALLHQVLAEEGFFPNAHRPGVCLYTDGADPARLVYDAVNRGYPVPMIPEWSEWLYASLKRKGHLEELRGNRKVLRLSATEEALDTMISEGMQGGEISFR
jgi:hypothetical protein